MKVLIFLPHLFLLSVMVTILTLTAANSVEARTRLSFKENRMYIHGTFRHRKIAGRQEEKQKEETRMTDSLEGELLWKKTGEKHLVGAFSLLTDP